MSSVNSNIYVFKLIDDSYILQSLTAVESGIPLSLNFSSDYSALIIATDKRKLVMMNAHTYELVFTH